MSTAAPPTTIYRIWAVRNVLSSGAILTAVDAAGSFTFNSPADAPQAGTSILLDTNNWRIRQAAGRDNSIWAAHTTVCNVGALPNESCARVVKLNVTPGSGSSNHTASVVAQTTFGASVPDVFYWMPGIAVNASLQTAIPFQHSSPSSHLSSSWTLKNDPDLNYPAAQSLTMGGCPQTQLNPGDTVSRTGDYVGAQTNPNDQVSFWLAGERATLLGGSCRWDTRIIQVTP